MLIVENHRPIATARLYTDDTGAARIGRVGVAAGSRGLGVGRRVIEEAEAWARELGFSRVVITSQKHAVGFYERLGYTVNPDIVFQSRIPIVHTEKNL